MEDLCNEGEHHLKRCALSLEISSLESIWSLYHKVDQWDRSLAYQVINDSLILKVRIDDVLIDSPHSFTNFILIVDEFCNNCETLISIGISRL